MVRNYKDIYFTNEDLNGFYLRSLSDKDKRDLKHRYIKEGLKVYLFCGLLFLLSCIFMHIANKEVISFLLNLMFYDYIVDLVTFILKLIAYAMLFVILLQVIITIIGVSKIKKLRCLNVSIVRKLPIEHCADHTAGINRGIDFYPIICKDISTGYESVCYVNKNQYENGNIGDTIKIFK